VPAAEFEDNEADDRSVRLVTWGRRLHIAWLVVASVLACVGLGESLEAKDVSERYLNPTSLSLYLGVVLLLAAVSYAVHRALIREPPDKSRRRAVADVMLAGALIGPTLLLAVILAGTIRDCSFGTGC
jgi:hypothetical protein